MKLRPSPRSPSLPRKVVLAAMITVYKVVTWKRRLLLLVVFEYLPPLALYATIVKLHGIRRACMDARVVRHTLDIVTEKYAELVHAGRDAAAGNGAAKHWRDAAHAVATSPMHKAGESGVSLKSTASSG